ncbi:WGR domain-containing protein [Chamaesiphon sp. GL140_3_metabinner_50]|uniref:WGR domain-containing protein n=1 Tax=Chamaesiphon sp. GL140_3_metabinner_50 TaxID=2970812 RepID=UPI0025E7271A|nr:WGR domain-containing protein [Chamaesiphon sp. GL140_3_metabinner_50]
MQLIQRKTLTYQAGNSDKVYEVDLAEVATDRYMVNYRYGKRGGTLREGAETVAAVPLAEAQKVFDRLVRSKVSKGYLEAGTAAPSAVVAQVIPAIGDDLGARDRAILARLMLAVNNRNAVVKPKEWQISRAIWRSGELQLTAAAPLLMQLWGNNTLTNYSIAWALGNCGDESAVPMLIGVYRQADALPHIRRIALEALFKLDPAQIQARRDELMLKLPQPLRDLVRNKAEIATIDRELQAYLATAKPKQFDVLDLLYQIDSDWMRPVLLNFIKTAPFIPNYFQRLRHIFKIAEYRQDAEVFGILAYRFETSSQFYNSNDYGIYIPNSGQYLRLKDWGRNSQTGRYEATSTSEFQTEMERSDSRLAYSSKTRNYLRRRVWRSLKTLGEEDRTEYVRLATGILLQYSDNDALPPRDRWDKYAPYLAFNHILYTNSPRYELKSGKYIWQCRSQFKVGDPVPDVREEAFPNLWERSPDLLLQLLVQSQCQPVHEFAVKSLKVCSEFCQQIQIDTLIILLEKPYAVTAEFGFELAKSRYQSETPQHDLILAIANCAYAPARSQAHQWLQAQIDRFCTDDRLIAALVISIQADTQIFMRQLLGTANIPNATAQLIIGRIIAQLLTLDATQVNSIEYAVETLITCFPIQLRSIGLEIVLDLLRHPIPALQVCGAQILLNHQIDVIDLPAGLIDALIESPVESVRVIGVRLFGQLPDEIMLERIELIIAFVTHELPEVRMAIRSTIHRLAAKHITFTTGLVDRLITILLALERYEGLHTFISQILQNDLPNWMVATSIETTWTLLKAPGTASQELAGKVLQANSSRWAQTLDTEKIAELSHHEILAVRESSWQMLTQILPRLRQQASELLAATMVMASKWEDARQFGFQLFGEILTPAELTPAIVISICDSNHEDVRRFGRDLVDKCFQQQDGLEYLLKFSEHPTTDMQLFASQYLENYAAGNLERLQELLPYFTRVLAQVNRARVAKQRIFAFLHSEAVKTEAAAKLVIEVLTRQSASIAIGEKARALETLLKIHQLYPQLSVPIFIKPLPMKT